MRMLTWIGLVVVLLAVVALPMLAMAPPCSAQGEEEHPSLAVLVTPALVAGEIIVYTCGDCEIGHAGAVTPDPTYCDRAHGSGIRRGEPAGLPPAPTWYATPFYLRDGAGRPFSMLTLCGPFSTQAALQPARERSAGTHPTRAVRCASLLPIPDAERARAG